MSKNDTLDAFKYAYAAYLNRHKGERPIQIQPIPKSWFPRIEYALGFPLNDAQKRFLNDYPSDNWNGGRASGQTIARIVKIALSIGPAIKMHQASDRPHNEMYSRHTFMRVYAETCEKLESAGFDCRKVLFPSTKFSIGGTKVDIFGQIKRY